MKARLHWWRYYYVTRKIQRILPWIAHRLPDRLKYWVVIDGMAKYTVVINSSAHPDDVRGWDLAFLWGDAYLNEACRRFHPGERCEPGNNHPGNTASVEG